MRLELNGKEPCVSWRLEPLAKDEPTSCCGGRIFWSTPLQHSFLGAPEPVVIVLSDYSVNMPSTCEQ